MYVITQMIGTLIFSETIQVEEAVLSYADSQLVCLSPWWIISSKNTFCNLYGSCDLTKLGLMKVA